MLQYMSAVYIPAYAPKLEHILTLLCVKFKNNIWLIILLNIYTYKVNISKRSELKLSANMFLVKITVIPVWGPATCDDHPPVLTSHMLLQEYKSVWYCFVPLPPNSHEIATKWVEQIYCSEDGWNDGSWWCFGFTPVSLNLLFWLHSNLDNNKLNI